MAKNKILKLEDANGQLIETTLDEIYRMVRIADLDEDVDVTTLTDNQRPLSNAIVKKIVDAKGNEVDPVKILDAAKSDKTKMPCAIDVLAEATHSGDNANSVSYRSDSMEKDTPTFMAPYKKPLIKNHDSWSEPMGRVKDAYFGPSELTDRDAIHVLFHVTDQDAMIKFMDGRYNTLSIGGSPKTVTCSICGKNILKDGVFKFCGHWRGDTYNNQKAIWSCTDITYNETSTVNNPADKWAQVKKITVLYPEDEDSQKKVGDNNMPANINTDADKTKNLVNEILGEDGNPTGNKDDEKNPPVEPEKKDPETKVNDGEGKEEKTPPAADTTKTADEDKDKKIAELETKVADLTKEKDALVTEKAELETKLTDEAKAKNDLSDKLILADAESKASQEQSLRLATKYKEMLVARVKDLNTATKGELTDEEISVKSIKELNDMVADLQGKLKPAVHQTPPPANNPGVVDNNTDPNVVKDDENKTKVTDTDYSATESSIIDGWVK